MLRKLEGQNQSPQALTRNFQPIDADEIARKRRELPARDKTPGGGNCGEESQEDGKFQAFLMKGRN